ncbi:hypothetical protein D3C81_1669530 [compost metagenome]
MEGVFIHDHMVSRQHQHHRIRINRVEVIGRSGNCRCGIAPLRLQQDRGRCNADLAQLFSDQEAMVITAYHQRRCDALPAGDTQHRILQHRALRYQRQQLLR